MTLSEPVPYMEYEYHDGVYEIRYRAVKKKKIAYASYGGIQGLLRFLVFHVNFRINEEAFFSETLILLRRDYWGSTEVEERALLKTVMWEGVPWRGNKNGIG